MSILIYGAGDTGTYLANTLSIENQDVVLIGTDRARLALLESTCNLITYVGKGTSAADLMNCGVDKSELFVAVTNDDNANIIAAEMAKRLGAKRAVARIDNPEYIQYPSVEIFKKLGIDVLIYPERLAAEEILTFTRTNWARDWFVMHQEKLVILGVKINSTSHLTGKPLKDAVATTRFFHICALKRGEGTMIPRGDTVIFPGDILYFTVLPTEIDRLREICGGQQVKVNKIMITGGGRITENFLENIDSRYNITVIEQDTERCRHIASKFPNVVVVNTHANDVATLKEEGIENFDMFLALTGSSEKNIVSCIMAREHGVPRTVARIEDLEYIPEAESLLINKIINKKLLNVSVILNSLIETDFDKTQCMLLDQAEIIQLTAHVGSKIVSKPIFQLSLPREITIGGLIRDNRGMLVDGHTQIMPGDRVIVFCQIGSLSKVERLFK